MRKLLTLLFLLVAPCAFAGPFDPPPTDQSVNLLGIIFGSNVGTIPLGGAPNPVLSDLMEKFNFIIVVVGLIIVSYVGIISIMNTANEGTAMGKKWSAVWVPMRSIAGMALMVPAPASGYSMIQVTVMWIIIQGIGAADALWNIALDGLASGASVTSGTAVQGTISKDAGTEIILATDGKNLATQLLNVKTCMATLYEQSFSTENQDANGGAGSWLANNGSLITDFAAVDPGNPQVTTPPATCIATNDAAGNQIPAKYAQMSGTVYFGVNSGVSTEEALCGALTVKGSVCSSEFANFITNGQAPSDQDMINAAVDIYYTKLNMISSMLTVLQPVAEGFAEGDYVQPLTSGETDPKQPPSGFISQAATQYENTLGGMVIQPPAGSTASLNTVLQQQVQRGKENGWIAAGSYYFVFNQALQGQIYSSVANDIITPVEGTIPSCTEASCANGFTTVPTNISNRIPLTSDQDILANNLAMAAFYSDQDISFSRATIFRAPGAETGEAASALGTVASFNSRAVQDIANLFNTNDPNTDPILAISLFGKSLMLGIEATLITVISLALVLTGLTLVPDAIGLPFGFNLYLPKTYAFAQTTVVVLLAITAVLLPVFMVFWAYGALLAVYVPLIPFMIFTMAALGWMLTVVEAVIAAPIVALGFVLPSGDDLGKIEHALALLANIFLRPMLMILGFLLASRVFKAVVMLVNFGMGAVFDAVNISTMFSTLIVIAVYATFIISIANTCFSLIYAVPDKILRWIGGPSEQTDTGAVNEAKATTRETAQNVGGGVKEMGKAAGKPAIGAAAGRLQGAMGGAKAGKGNGKGSQ